MADAADGENPFNTGNFLRSSLARAAKRGDIMLALGVVAILVVLILPLPTWMLDFALAFSITFSVLILMTALFVERPLDFNAFPTILLLATMIRLSLNLASTRLILSDGHEGTHAAGQVIEAFGGFVMSGNFIIGIIVFAILVIVNFVVITKGSGRIAEVSARFSLDAMPGKQMAIDADLSSGLIDEETAKQRRKDLEEESAFFGAMAPKNALSSSRSLRRCLAVSSSIRPDDKSASIAICLPGIASSEKRAETSAIRPEPFVITTKFTITRIAKTMMPMMKLPLITKPPKASMT